MNYEFIESFYAFKLSETNLHKIDSYINGSFELEYTHNEFDFHDQQNDVYYKTYRSCEIHYPPSESILSQIGKEVMNEINNSYYQYDLTDDFEFQLIKYYPGGHYEWHCDYGLSPKKNIYRKLSMTIQLSNSDDYEGGELEIVDYGNRTHVFPKEKGMFIVFDSKIPHRVIPVSRGQRIALVGWANGPKLK